MGNCQAIDNASIAIQHSSGRVDKLYSSVPAAQIINLHPSHYVALLLTPTTTTSAATATGEPLRITHIKLLRPDETLLLGHTYRLISAQEVRKELWAKKHAKMQKKQTAELSGTYENSSLHFEHQKIIKHKVITYDAPRPRKCSSSDCATARSRWHPSLNSISESSS